MTSFSLIRLEIGFQGPAEGKQDISGDWVEAQLAMGHFRIGTVGLD